MRNKRPEQQGKTAFHISKRNETKIKNQLLFKLIGGKEQHMCPKLFHKIHKFYKFHKFWRFVEVFFWFHFQIQIVSMSSSVRYLTRTKTESFEAQFGNILQMDTIRKMSEQ